MPRVELERRLGGSQVVPQRLLLVRRPRGAAGVRAVRVPRQRQCQRGSWGDSGVAVQKEEVVPESDDVAGFQEGLPVKSHAVVCDGAPSERPHQGWNKMRAEYSIP